MIENSVQYPAMTASLSIMEVTTQEQPDGRDVVGPGVGKGHRFVMPFTDEPLSKNLHVFNHPEVLGSQSFLDFYRTFIT